jgi:hypothetical protein
MNLKYEYWYNKEANCWESSLILLKDDGSEKLSVCRFLQKFSLQDWLKGFQSQIEALNKELNSETD